MKPVEQPLYPKLSSIYNKILQLVSAILLIIILMTIWLSTVEKTDRTISQHFQQTGKQFLQQAIAGTSTLLTENAVIANKKSRLDLLQKYLNNMAEADFVRDIHLYDETGSLLLASEHESYSASSINSLFGIAQARKTLDKSEKYVPFIAEIRHEKLTGYMRVTIERSLITSALVQENDDRQALYRILMIIAGLIGFLLTRGLNRFSRQGFRVPTVSTHE
ncbi:MAG: AhpA/YtjB family protein [Colwellia sp.]|nr:AhpA/YtjB family protein [Colwellia sp.]MCW8863745.1 AhpA/YtjB family protein [Colwellia sp.]MCW9081557.1 AhpA/YtjB family protein [Colwellia sp.]